MSGLLRPLQDLIASLLGALSSLTGNVGLAVILLTVIVRLVFHPLSRYGFKAIRKMQSLAPQMEVVRRKFKDDPQRANQEIMSLYRTAGVNPLGGCLPTLVQFPVLIALWNVLRQGGRFAGQTFLGVPLDTHPTFSAIAQNPYLVAFPLLIAATGYFQQRMSITDPQQARFFVFMPILFAWFSFNFPVGLSIYWIASTVVGIIEYYVVLGPPARRPPPPSRTTAGRKQGGKAKPA
ncbi:MAG TPA: YidC/Oxa1 family membrane protein insertase [bacterium]|jgi:YidC/Oxa1 family membrane protein insertase|nr:YidC/Oxa1 family membrane protein insertase [bacterium]